MMSRSVPRLVTVWVPDWPVHALVASGTVEPASAVAVMAGHRVLARSAAAEQAGVRHGMRRRDAQATCPWLVVVDADATRDARAFEPVLRALADIVPTVEVTDPGHVAFPTRGPSRRLGGDTALADVIDELLGGVPVLAAASRSGSRSESDAQGAARPWGTGLADGRFTSAVAARRSARGGVPVVVAPGTSAEFLAEFPTRALASPGGLPEELVDLLVRLGLRRLGDVASVPGPDLLARFGIPGRLAHRLATGRDETHALTAVPPLETAVETHLDEPLVQVQAVVFLARSSSETLTADLAARGLVCTRLVVEVDTDDGHRSSRAWYRAGGLSVAAMVERVRWQLEGLAVSSDVSCDDASDVSCDDTGRATGVVRLRLIPDEVRADTGHQAGFWGGETQADETAIRAVARLSALLGPDAVTVPEWRGGRDHAFALVPAASVDWSHRAVHVVESSRMGPWPGRLPAPSPAVRHVAPLPIEVFDDTGRRLVISGRGTLSGQPWQIERPDGQRAAVHAWAGPWPVEERWWDVRSRRAARLQMVVRERNGADGAHLVEVRDGRWWLVADYH
jgi:protein ImuB